MRCSRRRRPTACFASVSRSIYARAVFDDEHDTVAWLSAPNDALSGESPLSLLDTDAGVRLVEEVLTRIEFGVYS
jgi:putative toxin-antitoxin system antitoxin component (TIGR02293 family)